MLAPQQTIMGASANLRSEGAAANIKCFDFEHPTFQGRWRLFTNLDFYGILNTLPFKGSAAATNTTKKNLTIASSLRNRQILFLK